jgi:hypothetical protein
MKKTLKDKTYTIQCPVPYLRGCQITIIEGISLDLSIYLHQWIWHREEYLPLVEERIDRTVTHVT